MENLTESLNILTSVRANDDTTAQQTNDTNQPSDKMENDNGDKYNSKFDIDKNDIKDDNSDAPSNYVNNLDDENRKDENTNGDTSKEEENVDSPAKLDTNVLNKLFDSKDEQEAHQDNTSTLNEQQIVKTENKESIIESNNISPEKNISTMELNESQNSVKVDDSKPKKLAELPEQNETVANSSITNDQDKANPEVNDTQQKPSSAQPLDQSIPKPNRFKDDSSYTSSYSEDDEPFKKILNSNINSLFANTNNLESNNTPSPSKSKKSPSSNKNLKGTTHFVPTMSIQPREDDGVPPALKPLVYHSKDSLTYRALSGEQLHGLTQNALTSIVNDLRKYVDIAVDHNLIDEACHIQECIDNIRNDRSAEQMQTDKEIIDIDRRIQEARIELEERENFWRNQEYTIQKEFEMQLSDLMINKEQALSDLDNEWQSAKKQQQYSKPSPALLNMRHMAKKMIKSKQFKEVRQLAHLIEEKEQQEITDAMNRMNEDYHIADQRVNEHYENEQRVIESMHEMKMHSIIRSRDVNLRPINQRIENLEKLKVQAIKKRMAQSTTIASTPRNTSRVAKSSLSTGRPDTKSSSRPGTTSRTVTLNTKTKSRNSDTPQKQLPQLLVTPKLALQPVKRIKRDSAKTTIIQQGSPSQQQAPYPQRTSYTRNLSSLSNNPGNHSARKANLSASPLH